MALNGVTLSIESGEVFGLIGPNGAGKTTLMQCMLGLSRPTSGTILINGEVPNHLNNKRILAFLPERPLFESWMTARQFLLFHRMLADVRGGSPKEDVENALDRVQLDPAARSRKIKTYSKGMLQRVGLAQMLIGNPKLCFLDEPTSGLDPISRNIVRETILRWKAEGATVVLNSHHLDEVERVCDRVAFIQKGKIDLVEQTKHIQDSVVQVIFKWLGPDGAAERVEQIASQAEFECQILGTDMARFTLYSKQQIPILARALVDAQLDVEELFVERKNLESLFVSDGEAATGNKGTTGNGTQTGKAANSKAGSRSQHVDASSS